MPLKVTAGRAPGRDAAAFDWIGETVGEAIVATEVQATIWLAAAKIPGVKVVRDAVDAANRHGQALAFESRSERTEYIFDKTTHTYLGERSYLVKDTAAGKAGHLTGISAILSPGIANRAGQVPSRLRAECQHDVRPELWHSGRRPQPDSDRPRQGRRHDPAIPHRRDANQ
ncbi:hypothetical protein [Streptomyces sp. NPDC048489]|uniref:hypothetical protein n=1 Tax=Streptomyces sp. NPDC048489 TaxID=3154504 RepID=UPI003441ED9D